MRDLRRELVGMRGRLVGRLAQRLDGGDLALLGTVATALAAIDRVGADDAEPAQHVAVTDRPGLPIGIVLSSQGIEIAAEAALSPHQAIELAGELIAVALPRLAPAPRG